MALIWMLFPVGGLHALDNQDCFDCHDDSSLIKGLPDLKSLNVNPDRFAASVHARNNIGCTDCHRDIAKLDEDADVPHPTCLAPVDCANCHQDDSPYLKSAHAQARKNGNLQAPVCKDCHDYHYTPKRRAYIDAEKGNAICLSCHFAEKIHQWLPEADTHFLFIQCLVCHVPGADNSTLIGLYNKAADSPGRIASKPIPLNISKALKNPAITPDNFMSTVDKNHNEVIELDEFDELVKTLEANNVQPDFWGEMTVEIEPNIHGIVKNTKMKRCERCHSPQSDFYNRIYFTVSFDKGERYQYKAARDILESPFISHFYILEVSETKSIDQVGIVLVLLTAALVAVHLLLNIATIPLRRKGRRV